MGFSADYALLRMFLDRGCISCAKEDGHELNQFALTCSGITDFWARAQNPIWLIEFLAFMGYRKSAGLGAFAYEAASRVKHLVDPECWEEVMGLTIRHNEEEGISSPASLDQSYADWFQQMKSLPPPQCSKGLSGPQSARAHAYDAARALVMQDALLSAEFAVRLAALALKEEADERTPGIGERTRREFLAEPGGQNSGWKGRTSLAIATEYPVLQRKTLANG